MRIATYNVEWFDHLFDDSGALLLDDAPSGRHEISRRRQAEALGIVFSALDADAILIVEAPDTNRRRSTCRALENFASAIDLRARACLMGFANHTQQELALLYDPDRLRARHDPRGEVSPAHGDPIAPRFDGRFQWDLDIDARSDFVQFSKPPLEVALETNEGSALRLIGVHVKSKAPHGARKAADVMRISIENRRKQLAQCIWLRRRVDEHLDAGESVIVLGDLNDGPGLDEYEKLFGRSGVEIVIGDAEGARLYDPHAQMEVLRRVGARPASARFWIDERKQYMQALLDYILVSPDLQARGGNWRIWHPFDEPGCFKVPELRDALLDASDHFPVTLDITL